MSDEADTHPATVHCAGEPVTFPPIVHPWYLDLQLTGGCGHRPWLGHPIAHHQCVPGLVALVGVLRDVLINLSFERR
jgi:hypothetical protein